MYYFINAMIKDSVEKVINAEQQTKDKVILKIESFADPMIYRSIASMIISHLKQKILIIIASNCPNANLKNCLMIVLTLIVKLSLFSKIAI